MGIVQIQLIDLFTTPVIKMMTLRSKPKRPYHPRGRLEGYNVHFQNSESKADLRCSGHQCLLCGLSRHWVFAVECLQAGPWYVWRRQKWPTRSASSRPAISVRIGSIDLNVCAHLKTLRIKGCDRDFHQITVPRVKLGLNLKGRRASE